MVYTACLPSFFDTRSPLALLFNSSPLFTPPILAAPLFTPLTLCTPIALLCTRLPVIHAASRVDRYSLDAATTLGGASNLDGSMFLRAAFATGDTQIHILGTPGGPKGAAAAAAEAAAAAAGKAGAACDGSTTASESASQSKNDGKQAQPPKRAVSRTGSTSMTPNQAVVTALLLQVLPGARGGGRCRGRIPLHCITPISMCVCVALRGVTPGPGEFGAAAAAAVRSRGGRHAAASSRGP